MGYRPKQRTLNRKKSKMTERNLRKCSISFAIREMQIKTTLRFHLISVRMAKIKNMLERMWGKENTPPLLVGVQIGTAPLDSNFSGN